MSYLLEFHKEALKEWRRLDKSIQTRLKVKLKARIINPKVPAARLSGKLVGCYKIRDRGSGYRMVYFVDSERSVLFVLAVAKRENLAVYNLADRRKA
jgi:mRNA interferase RelE/StbE